MVEHYNFFSELIEGAEQQKFSAAILLGAVLVTLAAVLTSRLRSSEGMKRNIIPAERITPFGIFDFVVEAFTSYHDTILGKENRHHLSLLGSMFIFILVANLIGLIPGVPAITTTVWITAGVALVSFVYFNLQGVRSSGFWGYVAHFAGPVWWFAVIMFPLEILSTALRVLTLSLRLYWNISADHMVLEAFSGILGTGFARVFTTVFYGLGVFVCFMQALIFTTLSMVYILLATQHEEVH